MTLIFTHGPSVTGKVEPIQPCCCKVVETTQRVMIVDCVREMTVKKFCKYGEYGSFEHLLFFSSCLVIILCRNMYCLAF